MSTFFERIKNKVFRAGNHGSAGTKRKKFFHNIKFDENPEETWKTVGEIGDGSFGKVYKAQNIHNGQLAAAKICELKEEDELEDFVVEIDILSECRHPNIVQLVEAYFYEGKLWMLIEFCEGGAIDSIMMDLEKPLTETQIRYVCHEIVEGLRYLHEKKVIHRDLKAGNVLLTLDGDVKIADFGVSAKNKNTIQKRDSFIGTPYWMAPEVIMCETIRDNPYDYKADIWSLGITLIEFAQTEPPNHQMSPMRVLLKIQKGDPPKLDNPKKWSPEFNNFIAKCLIKDYNSRPNAAELLEHPFLKQVKPVEDKRFLLALISEYKAEVVEYVTEVNEDDDINNKDSLSRQDSSVENPPSTDEQIPPTPTTPNVEEVKKSTKRIPAPPPPVLSDPVTSTNGNDKDHAALEALQESIEEAEEEIEEQVNESQGQEIQEDDVVDEEQPPQLVTTTDSSSSNEHKLVDQNKIALFTDDNNPILNCDPEDISNCDDLTPCHTPQMNESVFDDDNCQVTILSNHSTIINTVSQSTPEDHRNISIVTIDDGKPISIQTSEVQSNNKQERAINDNYASIDKSTKGRIIIQTDKQTQKPLSNKNDDVVMPTSNANIKTTIKVNLNLKSENERQRQPNSPKRIPAEDNHVTTKIDQVTPVICSRNYGNHERNNHHHHHGHHHHGHHHKNVQSPPIELNNKSLKRESSNSSSSNFGSVGSSDKENVISNSANNNNNRMQQANDQSSAAVLIRKKQRDMESPSRRDKKSAVSNNHSAQKKTLKTKTRKFVVDGVVVTTTTQKVIDGESDKNNDQYLRKQELRELKMLQKHEIKQLQELECRSIAAYDAQEKKFDIEMAALKKSYDSDLESLIRQQKMLVEKGEEHQQVELKLAVRRIKQDQERELKNFREALKAEHKLLKQEVDQLPKDKRKEEYRIRKDRLDKIHADKERQFIESLNRQYEYNINKLNQSHREKLAMMERQFLQQKQQLLRAREAAIWELEEKHIYNKYSLLKKQLNESFFLQRHQMLDRHEKELEHYKRWISLQEEELLKRQAIEKRSLPKRIRSEMKTREMMYRESLRISMANLNNAFSNEDEREKLKRFQESEKQRYKDEQARQELKHQKQIESLKNRCLTVIHELEQIQKDKKKALCEHEILKLNMLEEEHAEELKQWKSQLKPRKQKLEEEFIRQIEDQERFYATTSATAAVFD